MNSVVVGGVPIRVAPGGAERTRLDAVDRARALDNTYRASVIGNAKREWRFTTPPVSRSVAGFYERVLQIVGPQTCTGDLLGGSKNLLLYSEEFERAEWGKDGGISVGADLGVAPDGSTSMDRLVRGAGALTQWAQIRQEVANPAAQVPYTGSIWVQSYSSPVSGHIKISDRDFATYSQPFTTTTPAQRISFTTGSTWNPAGTVIGLGIDLDVPSDAFLWGAQLEPGSSATGYAHTTSAGIDTLSATCCAEMTGWTPVRVQNDYYVVITFELHEV